MTKPQPLALKAVIAPVATAIRVGGQDGETVRLTLDVYGFNGEPVDINAVSALRGKELTIVLSETE